MSVRAIRMSMQRSAFYARSLLIMVRSNIAVTRDYACKKAHKYALGPLCKGHACVVVRRTGKRTGCLWLAPLVPVGML